MLFRAWGPHKFLHRSDEAANYFYKDFYVQVNKVNCFFKQHSQDLSI